MNHKNRPNTAGTYYGADVKLTLTLSRMWIFVKYSEGTWKSEKAKHYVL